MLPLTTLWSSETQSKLNYFTNFFQLSVTTNDNKQLLLYKYYLKVKTQFTISDSPWLTLLLLAENWMNEKENENKNNYIYICSLNVCWGSIWCNWCWCKKLIRIGKVTVEWWSITLSIFNSHRVEFNRISSILTIKQWKYTESSTDTYWWWKWSEIC